MVEVRKKENESTGSLLRRFTKRVQASGFLMRIRKSQYRLRPLSQYKKKKRAIHKIGKQKEISRLKKLGKL
jgi:ribosomal protein S21